MKKFDGRSFVAGIVVGTLGITTAFGATSIRSASLSSRQITLKGVSLSPEKPLVEVTMDDEQASVLYVPAEEVFEKLGYGIHYDSTGNIIDLIPGSSDSHEVLGDIVSQGNVVMDLANHAGQTNIAESGSFQAEQGQTLVLTITSDIKGGSVDLFLFDPNGRQQRVTIGAANVAKEIPLEQGIWQYNCSGVFKDGGNVKIVGTVK